MVLMAKYEPVPGLVEGLEKTFKREKSVFYMCSMRPLQNIRNNSSLLRSEGLRGGRVGYTRGCAELRSCESSNYTRPYLKRPV